jgi:drug/metabolite transporter (DMT)-like permease
MRLSQFHPEDLVSRYREWAAFVFLGVVAWGTSFLWIKVALRELDPLTVVMYRMVSGALAAWLITRLYRVPWTIRRDQWKFLLPLGIFYTAIPISLITWAETHIDSGLAGLLNGSVPLFTMLFAHFALPDDRFSVAKVSGLLLGFSGITLLVSHDAAAAGVSGELWGELAVVLATLLYGICNVVVRLRLKGIHPVHMAAVNLSSAAVTMILLVALFETPLQIPQLPLTWLACTWMGVVGLSLAYVANFYLLNSWGATRSATVTYLIPVSAVSLGVIFLGERPGWELFAGGALVIGGIALVNLTKSAAKSQPA